jgi:selenocysteine lyase/cysteine desulfurase
MDPNPSHEELQGQFPTLAEYIYANHAAISPWPRKTALAVQRFAEKNYRLGPLAYPEWLQTDRQLRGLCADMLNAASPDDIALLKNTSEGINLLANGIDWESGDNIVSTANEFISNRLPWQALAGRGVELRRIDVRGEMHPEQALLAAMDKRTRLLCISSVQWADGFRLHLERLGEACRASGTIFFVDAIQHFGALRLDVRAGCVDAMCAGSHKWQLGPEGMAVFYCHPALRESLSLSQWGWHMLERPFQFDVPGRAPVSKARRYEAGSPSRIGQVALYASLGLLHSYGVERVERDVLANTGRLLDGLAATAGLTVTSDTAPERRSGIVSFACRHLEPDAFVARLREAGVLATRRGASIRLSPHFYQPPAQIDALLQAVEHVAREAQ